MADGYRFPGIRRYSEPAVVGVRVDFAGKVAGEWFVGRAVDALTLLETVPPESRAAVLQQAKDALAALVACVKTVEGAVADAERSLFPPDPGPGPEPTPDPLAPEVAPERSRRRDR